MLFRTLKEIGVESSLKRIIENLRKQGRKILMLSVLHERQFFFQNGTD